MEIHNRSLWIHRFTVVLLCFSIVSVLFGQNLMPSGSPLYKLPYKNTYVMETLVAENSYRTEKPTTTLPGTFEQAKKVLPQPYWENHNDEIAMYWHAWKLALSNMGHPKENSGFVNSYIAPAYNGNIFMWDDAFITMFCHYGQRFFPFQATLNNFYSKQHPDGFICREIRVDGSDCFSRYDPTSTGPNILPWSEWLYFTQYGDEALDACLQQIMVANILLKMGFYLERWQEIETFEDDIKQLSAYIERNMWNKDLQFLCDQYADDSLSNVKGIYAYWALHTDVLSKERLDQLVAHLSDTTSFNRPHRTPSLAASNPKYKANGRYWLGGVWPGTNYMLISGLTQKGYRQLAFDIAMNHYDNVFKVYKDTGTFWEYYAPEDAKPGFMARKDFVGWTGLPPIAVLIEYIFGIRANLQEREITLDVTLTDAYGIKKYPFGENGSIDIKVEKRSNKNVKPKVTITTNEPFKLLLLWENNKKEFEIRKGSITI